MKSVSKRERIMLIVLIVFFIFFVYYKLFLNPVLVKAVAIKDQIKSYNSEIIKLKQAAVLNEKLKLQLDELNAKFKEDVNVLPDYEKDPEIAYELKVLGDKNSTVVKNVSIAAPALITLTAAGTAAQNAQNNSQPVPTQQNQDPAKSTQNQQTQNSEPRLYSVMVNLSATGSYTAIKGFITSIETDTRTADISSVNLTLDQNGTLNAAISLNYYYLDSFVKTEINYGFNKGKYGKQDLFK